MMDETTLEGVSHSDDENALASALEGIPEATEAPAQEAAEPQAEQESETPDAGDGEGDPEESGIETLEQFAKEAGVDLNDLLTLKVKLKVDGEEKDATLQDLIKINQLEGHVNRKSIELSEKQKAWETQETQFRQDWNQRLQMAGTAMDSQEQQLAQEYQSVDWNTLYQQDPAQYSALQLRFQQANGMLQQQKQQLAQHYTQTTQQMRETIKPKALEMIHSQHPDLSDPVSYGNALGDIKGYLKSIGANESNFDAVELDPVVFRVARDAARYQQIVAKKPDVANKVKTAPKMQRPSPKESLGASAARLKSLREQAGKGNQDAMAQLLESL